MLQNAFGKARRVGGKFEFGPVFVDQLRQIADAKEAVKIAEQIGYPETDEAVLETFPAKSDLARWIAKAREKVHFQGLPARICWLEYGERAEMGLRFNWLVKHGRVQEPIVIGRDHLDTGSVASPNRETEAMKDGSDAIADWPLLNALLNTACGASWVSLHHGGGVGIGYSIHSGMVAVAEGSAQADRRLERVLTADPGTGVMRHADAGYDEAIETAEARGLDLSMITGVAGRRA